MNERSVSSIKARAASRFLQMLLNGGQWNGTRILKPATVREMTGNQIRDLQFMSPTDRFGYGFGIVAGAGKDQVGAVGSYYWGGFYHTGFWVDPEKKLVGVLIGDLFVGALANDVRRGLTVDNDRGGGLVNWRQPGRNHDCSDDRSKHKCQNFPAAPLQNPKIMR